MKKFHDYCAKLINQNRACTFFNVATAVSFLLSCMLAILNVFWPESWHEPVLTSFYIYDGFFLLTVVSMFTEANHKDKQED